MKNKNPLKLFEGEYEIFFLIDGIKINIKDWKMEHNPIQKPKSDIEENEPNEQWD